MRVLSQAEQLHEIINDFNDRVAESRGGALSAMRRALQDIGRIARVVEEMQPLQERFESAFFEVEDVADSVRKYEESVDFSSEKLDEYEQRLVEIRRLEKKYGSSVAAVLAYRHDAVEKLARIENLDAEKARLRAEIEAGEKRMRVEAQRLSEERRLAAARLEGEIGERLASLGMGKSVFSIRLSRKERDGRPVYTRYGVDEPEFLIASNEGEPARPLKDVASGGELSRIMLAIKSVLADSDTIRTLIFDEIDVGIGGAVAVSVGEHLASLATKKQVLCITHLPTIAVRADQHYSIEKTVAGGRTIAVVRQVRGEERVSEIARMLSGDSGVDVSRSHARELLERAGKL